MKQTSNKPEGSARDRLLDAAMDVFGRYGYEGATTRMIANEADVNIAAIPYYFKNKEGLYHALINQIVAVLQSRVSEVKQEIAESDFSGEKGRRKAHAMIEQLLENIIIFMVGSPEAPRVSRIILREQLYPSAAYDLIFKGFMESTLDSLSDLIVAMSPKQTKKKATLRAMALIGQIIIFRVARETIVRALNMEAYSSDELEEVRQVILEHTRASLAGIS